jgi:hypothetical protein
MCVPLASLHGDQLVDNITNHRPKQPLPCGLHGDGLSPHCVLSGVPADGSGLNEESAAGAALQQVQPWCQAQLPISSTLLLRSQQQLQQQQQQQATQLLFKQHRQTYLMQGLHVLQQPLLQRDFSTSAQACNIKPQLHQPMKHVSGTDPLKKLRVANASSTIDSWASRSRAEQQAAEAAAAAADSSSSSSSKYSLVERVKQRWLAGCGLVQQKWQAGQKAAARLQDRVAALPWHSISTAGMTAGACVTGAVASECGKADVCGIDGGSKQADCT